MRGPISTSLTIAGTDPSGGAGIQADLKTFQEFQSYGMSVITSVVAQNTTGVQAVHHLPIEMIEQQLESVITDIPVHAFKTGMIANIEIMEIIAKKLPEMGASYVMDPVMVATSGDPLISEDARRFLRDHLLPHTTLATPNIPEAESLTEIKIETEGDMRKAAIMLVEELGASAVLVTGGHLQGDAVDIFYDGDNFRTYQEEKIHTKNTHGTGCALSAAITACLSKRIPLQIAIQQAKDYITAAIRASFALGHGNGPTNHFAARMSEVGQ